MERILLGLLFVAPGEVVALSERRGRRVMYAAVIRFTGLDGPRSSDEVSSNPPAYRVGDRVRVLYHRTDPNEVRIGSPPRL